MDATGITAETVRDTLNSLRADRPLAGSKLMGLGVLGDRLRRRGERADAAGIERELAGFLASTISARLAALRSLELPDDAGACDSHGLAVRLQEDFACSSVEREAWSCLYHRFVLCDPWRVRRIAATVRPGQPTATRLIRRRVVHGVEALAAEIRRQEAGVPLGETRGVPQYLDGFVGRAAELDRIAGQLRTRRLVTLTGPAGVGKTRIAAEFASRLARQVADLVVMVDLQSVPEAQAANTILTALSHTPTGGDQSPRRARHVAAGDRLLLVVDNCDHLVDVCRTAIDRLLAGLPNASVLATSLAPLRLAGEVVIPITPLPVTTCDATGMGTDLPDAVLLFLSRADAVCPGLGTESSDALRIGRLCSRLEGFPLAIELAARLTRLLSLDQLEERLADQRDLLAVSVGGSRPRHSCPRAALDWTYGLLSPQQQAVLRRLAVFRGGWTLEAAEAVATGPDLGREAVLGVMAELSEVGLVAVRDTPAHRYHMLETIREYALARLVTAGEREAARDAHLDWCLRFLDTPSPAHRAGSGQARGPLLMLERENLAAAEAWSRARGDPALVPNRIIAALDESLSGGNWEPASASA